MSASVPATAPPSVAAMVGRLVRFDLRRHRLLFAVVIGLELVRAAVAEWSLKLAPAIIGEHFGGVAGQGEVSALDLAIWLATWVATAVVVQGDHPSDDRAFWRSRPIPPVALAASKLVLFGVVFVLIPSALNAARLFAYGAPASAPIVAALEIAMVTGLTVVVAWSGALVTRTLVRFFAACFGVVVAFYVSLAAFAYYQGFGTTGIGLEPAAGVTDNTWIVAALPIVGLGILVLHYRLRRPAIAALAGLAVLLGSIVMPGSRITRPAPPDLAKTVAGRLTLPDGVTVPEDPTSRGFAATNGWPIFLQGRIGLPALPIDVSAGVILRNLTLRTGDRTVQAVGAQQCCSGPGAMGAIAAPEPAEPAGVEPGHRARQEWNVGGIPAADVEAIRAGRLAIVAEATVVFVRHHLVAAIPLRAGAAFRGGTYLVEVLGVEPRSAVALLRVARFPTFGDGGQPLLTFFEADRERAHVATTSAPYPIAAGPMGDNRSWGEGRHWADRLHLPIHRRYPPLREPQLLIVESRRVGESRTALSATNVPVQLSKPQ